MKEKVKDWIASAYQQYVVGILIWVSTEIWRGKEMKQQIITFLVDWFPLCAGVLGFFLTWLIKSLIKVSQLRTKIDQHKIKNSKAGELLSLIESKNSKEGEFESLKKTPPMFKTVEVIPDNSTDPKIVYKSKVRIVLTNMSEQDCFIRSAIWKANGNIPLELPSKLGLRVEANKGEWQSNKWSKDEIIEGYVRSGYTFSTWIGLRQSLSENDFIRIRENRQFGTLLLKIDGYEGEIEIPV